MTRSGRRSVRVLVVPVDDPPKQRPARVNDRTHKAGQHTGRGSPRAASRCEISGGVKVAEPGVGRSCRHRRFHGVGGCSPAEEDFVERSSGGPSGDGPEIFPPDAVGDGSELGRRRDGWGSRWSTRTGTAPELGSRWASTAIILVVSPANPMSRTEVPSRPTNAAGSSVAMTR